MRRTLVTAALRALALCVTGGCVKDAAHDYSTHHTLTTALLTAARHGSSSRQLALSLLRLLYEIVQQ